MIGQNELNGASETQRVREAVKFESDVFRLLTNDGSNSTGFP